MLRSEGHGAGQRTVLVVEDNPGDADLIVEKLRDREARGASEHRIIFAETLRGAEEQLRAERVDVVLLDLRLPDGSGVECVQRVRGWTNEVPIIVLTGLDDDELALACLAAGAQDYLSKQGLASQNLRRAIGYGIVRALELKQRRRADNFQRRLASIVEASSDAIVSSTLEGVVTSWNRGAEKIFGYSRDEAIGRPVSEVMRPVDPAGSDEQVRRILEQRSGARADEVRELERLSKDGRRLALSVVACALQDEQGAVTGLAAICRDVTESRSRDHELRRRNEELLLRDRQMRALTSRLNAVREEERTRISREVHDQLGQLLTGLRMDLRWIARRLTADSVPSSAPIQARLREAEALIDKTVESVQRIAVELRPSALDALGLPAALRDEARRFEARAGVASSVRVRVSTQPPAEVSTTLFRVFQELLSNVALHAHASLVGILLEEAEDSWLLQVEDDGVGLAKDAEHRSSSLGLLGIRERAGVLGGTLELVAAETRGTVAKVIIPKGEATHDEARTDSR